MKGVLVVFAVIALLVGCLFVLQIGGFITGWLGEGAQVAREELGPRALLKKYEWFKDVAARLQSFESNISVFEATEKATRETYGEPASWPRDVREDLALQRQEVQGQKLVYNDLAAQYNAQMAKINWRFCNIGTLPEGANEPLPREFTRYLNK